MARFSQFLCFFTIVLISVTVLATVYQTLVMHDFDVVITEAE